MKMNARTNAFNAFSRRNYDEDGKLAPAHTLTGSDLVLLLFSLF